MSDWIKEVQNSSIRVETKQKTIETLSAITGMLQSLRDKKILTEDSFDKKRSTLHLK